MGLTEKAPMKFAAYPKSYFQNLSRAALDQRAHVEAKGVFHKSKACRTGQFHNRCGICDRAPDAASDALVAHPQPRRERAGAQDRSHRLSLESIRGCPELRSGAERGYCWLNSGGLLCPSCDVFSVSEEQVRHKTGGHCPICDGQLKR